MLILTEQDLRQVLPMADVIRVIEQGLIAISRGQAVVPERLRMNIPWAGAVLFEMPAGLAPDSQAGGSGGVVSGSVGTKLVTVFPDNSRLNKPTVQASYFLLDGDTGAPVALMEGRFVTAIRTAATSAVATKSMASGGSKQLAVLGAGVQGAFHIDAMREICELTRVLIASRSRDRAEALAQQTRDHLGLEAAVTTPAEAVSSCDLICTCTTSPTPLFNGQTVQPGTHINAVGSFTPETRELDTEVIRRARVVIDAASAAGREAGDILIPLGEGAITPSHIAGELADVVSGRTTGRTSVEEITVFKSCGLAIEDLVTARLAYRNAIDGNIGTCVDF